MVSASGMNFAVSPDAAVITGDIGSDTRLATSGEFRRYLTEQILENSAMIQSGLIQTESYFNNVTGVLVEAPFFGPLDFDEENVKSSNDWGLDGNGRYRVQGHKAKTQYAPIYTRGAAFGKDMLSGYQTGEDALENVAQQLSRALNKKYTAKILAQFTGLFSGPLAGTHTINNAVPAGESAAEANYISAAAVTRAKYLLGENAQNMGILVVHPEVAADLEILGMQTFRNDSGTVNYASNGIGITSTDIKVFAGLRVIIDSQVPKVVADGATADGATDDMGYCCYIGAPGAVKTGSQFPITIKEASDALSLQDLMSVTVNRVDHVLGTSYKGPMEPENSEFAKAANWDLAFDQPEMIPLVELTVNASSGLKVPAP